MNKNTKSDFFEILNLYPSPHNGQPIRLKELSGDRYEILFEKERGLQSVEISYIFSFVSIGLFVKYTELTCEALGHNVEFNINLPNVKSLAGSGLLSCGTFSLESNIKEPNENILKALKFRQTSRKKYKTGINDSTKEEIYKAIPLSMNLSQLDKNASIQTVWLNQRAVFDDIFNEPVRQELNHWLRYNQKEKAEKMDGLAYDCMEINGSMMKYIINHPKILRTPLINNLLKSYYMRTMKDNSDVFYMMAPFETELDSFSVGKVIMEIWNIISQNGYYLHPFGTIMSNELAHKDFLELVGEQNESKKDNYLVFIFRAGSSDAPVRSLRLPIDKHLIMEN